MKHWISLAIIGLLITSACDRAARMGESTAPVAQPASLNTRSSTPGNTPAPQTPLVIRKGTLAMETDDIDSSLIFVRERLRIVGGYVEREEQSGPGSFATSHVTMRVPVAAFDGFVEDVKRHALQVVSLQVETEDVTAEFVDVQARLKTKYALESRYREFFTKAKNIEEMLNVEERISDVRADIESMEAQIRKWESQTAYSTLAIHLSQPGVPTVAPDFFSRLATAFADGGEVALSFLVGIVYLWPFLILFTGVAWLIAFYKKRSRHGVTAL